MSEIKLRDYQQQAVDKIKERYADGNVIFPVGGAYGSLTVMVTADTTAAALDHYCARGNVTLVGEGVRAAGKVKRLAATNATITISAGTVSCAATDPFGRDRNGTTEADRERAAWNVAVDMRKAARAGERLQRRWGNRINVTGINETGDWVSEWAEGGAK